MITPAVADVILIGADLRMAVGSCRLFGVKWGLGVGRLAWPKPKCVFAKNETALRLGGAAAVSVPYFSTRPSACLPTSPRRYPSRKLPGSRAQVPA